MALELKILTLNCWGIPFISKDRKPRMQAIAEVLYKSDYDVVCLQEVWADSDYRSISQKVKEKLPYSHYFHSGVVGSGVCVISKYPFQEVFFHQWPVNGYIHKLQHGDWFGGKGVGLCRLLVNNYHINIYSAHLHAEYDRDCDEYMAHRVIQAFDTAQFIRLTGSSADLIVLAGDLNTEPGDLAYRILMSATGLTDAFTKLKGSDNSISTNERYSNSYTDESLIQKKFPGKRIDYVMYRSSQNISTLLQKYEHPLPERVPGKTYSYSDHEAVSTSLQISSMTRPKSIDSTDSIYKSILVESMKICEEALNSLGYQKRFYIFVTLALFFLLIFTVGVDAPLGFIKTYYLLRIIVTGLMFFTMIMSTLWNNIEHNAIIAGKLTMEINLKQLEASENKKNI